MVAISIVLVRFFLPPPNIPTSFISRNSINLFFHWFNKLTENVIINVLTLLNSINLQAVTVLPKAVGASNIPISYFINSFNDSFWLSYKLPLNFIFILLPLFLLSIIFVLILCELQ